MDNQKMDLTKIKQNTVLGDEIIRAGDTPQVREVIYSQIKDNFCIALDVIGYYNMVVLAPALALKVALFVKNLKKII